MTAKEIKGRLSEMCSHFTFEYNGKECGVDPINKNNFDMWYGDNFKTAADLDEVMTTSFFGGKSLNEISSRIEIIDF